MTGTSSPGSAVDFTPVHGRLNAKAVAEAVRGIVDLDRFELTFHEATGPNAKLLQPRTVRGPVQAVGSFPLEVVEIGESSLVRIPRLRNGKIPIRLDMRLLKNRQSLRTVLAHEVAEAAEIIKIEGKIMNRGELFELLELADDAGYAAEG